MSCFSMSRLVSKCIAEFGAAAPSALRSGHAPTSELDARACGEYTLAYVDGEFDFSVAEMVSGVFTSDTACTRLAASDMLDMCIVEIEVRLTRLVVGAVVAAMLSRREPEKTTLACLPDALLARIANLAKADLRVARADYAHRRNSAEYELYVVALDRLDAC
jgi:hypothetical protein